MTAGTKVLIKLTSDEVNCLIYSYLKDSGFDHTAFNLRTEAHLHHSPNINVALPRGELIALLRKAVLFQESEEAFHNKGKTKEGPITLLGRYRTAADGPVPDAPAPTIQQRSDANPAAAVALGSGTITPNANGAAGGVSNPTGGIIKPKYEDDTGRAKKRARTDDTDDEVVEVLNPNSVGKKANNGTVRLKAGVVVPADGQPPGTMMLRGHDAEVFAAQWNPNFPNLLASGGKGGQVIIWKVHDLPTRGSPPKSEARTPLHSIVAVLPPPRRSSSSQELKDLTSMAWNKAGTVLAVGHQDATIQLWSHTGQLLRSQAQHSAPVFDLAWSDDGNRLISAGLDGLSICWDTSIVSSTHSLWVNRGHEAGTCCLDAEWLGPNYYATCGTDKRIFIYGRDRADVRHCFEGHKDEVNQIRLSPNSLLLASVSDDKTCMIWDVSKWVNEDLSPAQKKKIAQNGGPGAFVQRLGGGHEKPVSMVQWMPTKHEDGYNLLATFSREAKSACLWDIRTGHVLRKFNEYSPGIPITRDLFTHGFDPTGRFYALGGVRFLVIYSLKTGKALWTWPFADSYVADVVWQKGYQGRRLAVAKENGLTVVIDISQLGVAELADAPPSDAQKSTGTPKSLPASPAVSTAATPVAATATPPSTTPTVAS